MYLLFFGTFCISKGKLIPKFIFANGDFNTWVGGQFLTALYTFLSTMALGLTVVYIIYVTAKLSGFLDKIRNTKDPRRDVGHQ